MGEVYRSSDDRLGRDVALKLLKSSLSKDPDRLRRFEQEARSAAALNHPNIVAIYDIGVHEGAPYIVSEFLEGRTLRQQLLEGPLGVRQANDYAIQIAQGLIAAHERRIVHRDLKPENLFITKDGRIKILDFGIAKLTMPEAETPPRSVASLTTQTKAGSILGTAGYMSPEQLRGKPVDHRSDIFSFGAILYEMLTGKRAFSGETEVDTMMAVLQEDSPEIAASRPNIPNAFEHIVRHCLEKEPENRFQSARDLAFALGTVSNITTAKQALQLRTRRIQFRKWLPWLSAALLLGVVGVLLGANLKPVASPAYRRLTFERGTVYSARFAPDGRSVVYGASWNGRPMDIYSTIDDSPVARPLGLNSAHLLALSRSNELALTLRGMHGSRRDFVRGTLARAPLAGGTPRELLEDVRWADWGPDGQIAVVHHTGGRSRLEYPIGKVLYETSGWISHIRFSPQGERIAFMDHPALWDDRGSVCVVDLNGVKQTLSADWETEEGLAWSPHREEIWFTAVRTGATNRALWAVDLSGRTRKVLSMPTGFTLQDIASDGRVLITLDAERLAMEWAGKSSTDVQDLSWYDWSIAKDLSEDGRWVLFEESSEPAGPSYAVAIRRTDGSPPIRLGDGTVGGLSPDGKWALAIYTGTPQRLRLLPIGAGQPREISLPGVEHLQNGSAHFLPDGRHVVFIGSEPGRPARTFMVDLVGGKPTPVTPEGVFATLASPDGKYLVGVGANETQTLFPIQGGDPRPIPKLRSNYSVARWSSDSQHLFVYRDGEMPLKLYRADVNTGAMTLLREIVPADRAGVVTVAPVVTNQDASEVAYSYYLTLSIVFVVSGLS
jgi:serine/threonine protein kinase